jgi:hypothetical protein
VAEHDRLTVLIRQTGQFLVENGLQVLPGALYHRLLFRQVFDLNFLRPPLGSRGTRFQRPVVGHSVEPIANPFPSLQREGLPHQDEKGFLESVVGIVRVSQNTAANAQHHRPVPPHQRFESGLFPPSEEVLQEFSVRHASCVLQEFGPAFAPCAVYSASAYMFSEKGRRADLFFHRCGYNDQT